MQARCDETPHGAHDFIGPEGEMAALIRAKDWSATPLGPPESWSQSLRMMVSFLLANRFPLLLWWGSSYISLYNDAYRPILGDKHPQALGQPVRDCWSEIWPVLQPLIDTPFSGGPSTWMEDLELGLRRRGFVEETHFTVAYSPVPDVTAPRGIGGVVATVHEITDKVIGERRVQALRDLSFRAAEARVAEDACAAAAQSLAVYPKDVPFALLYLLKEPGRARLAAECGCGQGEAYSPIEIEIAEGEPAWPLAAVMRSQRTALVEPLDSMFPALPPGAWDRPPRAAAVVPIRSTKAHELAGFLVAGVSSRIHFDERYQDFLELTAAQIAAAVANARSYEAERRRTEALAEIDRAKTAFFSNVSHEFRTPLTLMLGPLEDALRESERTRASEDQRRRLDLAHRNGLRLLRLVNSLLDFSRIEAGRAQASYEPTDLAMLTTDLISGFRSAIERAGLFLRVACEPIPEPVYVDRDMWEKIVLNLMSNAFKFTFEGGVSVSLRPEQAHAVLSVRDTGVGIPEPELPRLFDRFHRIEGQPSRSYEGSGIGLALVHEFVKLHGGAIETHSRVGEGTEFLVSIPLGRAHLDESTINAKPTGLSTAARVESYVEEALRWLADAATSLSVQPAAPRRRDVSIEARELIVLADDNADMRDYVRRLLESRYEVVAVGDGEAALAAIASRRPALVLADVMMPILDGFGLAAAIRKDALLRDLPVIFLSARAGEESRVEGLEAGADDYLVKPFSANELLARVDAAVNLARHRAEAHGALEASERRFRALIEASSDAIYRMSPDWREMRHLTGRDFIADSQDPTVEWLDRYIPVDERDRVQRSIADAVARKAVFELEHRVLRADGSVGWTFSRAVPLLDGRGEILEWFGIATDITERKRSEEKLLALNERLEVRVQEEVAARQEAQQRLARAQQMEALGQLAGGIAHDFNNVLQAVSGGLSLITRSAENPLAVRRLAQMAADAAKRGAAVTGRLLAFARRGDLRATTVRPQHLLENLKEILGSALGPDIRVEIAADADAPLLHVDAAQLETVLVNLAVNARDAMPDGGTLTISARSGRLEEPRPSVSPLPRGSYVRIAVADTGVGMNAETLARCMEPFFTTKPPGKGTGLGLSMARGFAEQSGGALTVRSTPGAGATVTLWLPEASRAAKSGEDGGKLRAAERSGARVLVVDDDPMVRSVLVAQMSELGYRVAEASDGLAALERLDGDPRPDLIVTDFAMPGMNGLLLIEEARRAHSRLPAVLLTGYADAKIDEHGLDARIVLLRKPISRAELADAAANLLDAALRTPQA